jgi:hypothetical protein
MAPEMILSNVLSYNSVMVPIEMHYLHMRIRQA